MISQEQLEIRQPLIEMDPLQPVSHNYRVSISQDPEDSEWDAFLERTPGGHHVQTSLWAQVKALVGWQALRLVVRQGDTIVAGAQVLYRRMPLMGGIGYISKGPIFAEEDPSLWELVVRELKRLAKAYRLQSLVVQPPDNGLIFARQFPDWGFHLSTAKLGLSATVLLDLTQDLDTILAQLKSKTRYNVRLGQRKGISVRQGTERDLAAFYHMLLATGERQGFSSNTEEYFSQLWRILNPHGYCELFLAEYQGEPVSGLLAIPFGDTVIYKRGAWSGRHGKLRPNEVMHWAAIEWAKSKGYHYYDFEGIDPKAARMVVQGEPIPDTALQTVTRFKLGFGGQVMLLPDTYGYMHNRFLGWANSTVYPKVAGTPAMKKVLRWMRTR